MHTNFNFDLISLQFSLIAHVNDWDMEKLH